MVGVPHPQLVHGTHARAFLQTCADAGCDMYLGQELNQNFAFPLLTATCTARHIS